MKPCDSIYSSTTLYKRFNFLPLQIFLLAILLNFPFYNFTAVTLLYCFSAGHIEHDWIEKYYKILILKYYYKLVKNIYLLKNLSLLMS